jgi:hypothetical protein
MDTPGPVAKRQNGPDDAYIERKEEPNQYSCGGSVEEESNRREDETQDDRDGNGVYLETIA